MKDGYIPKEQRKKILLLCDDIRVHSGVAGVAREMVINTCHRYNWVNLGGAVKHPEEGKKFDISEDTNKHAGIKDSSVTLYPTSGYGTPDLIRQMMRMEKPDAIFLITDPRYFTWLFQMEAEIRKQIPIIYLNIWDDYPAPVYNRSYYQSCDALLGISKQTVNINKLVLGEEAEEKVIKYVPHGISTELFKPLEKPHKGLQDFQQGLFKGKEFDFVTLFNSRNIRRKQIPDTLLSFRMFLDTLSPEERKKAALVLHTQKADQHGTDLPAIVDLLFEDDDNIIFSDQRLDGASMNYLYNSTDVGILLSSNEGWGLALTECMHTGTPFIANVTGGMQDQMRFIDDEGNWFTPSEKIPSNHSGRFKEHGEWAFPVFPSNRSIQGSVPTPYIWDDRVDPKDAADALTQAYNLKKEGKLKEKGLKGREWALGEEAGFTARVMGERIIEGIDETFDTFEPRVNYEFFKVDYKKQKLVHQLYY
jgi:glycosyltransferase involved in cell wall biosynthesis